MYKHFLLLVVTTRILCDLEICLDLADYAQALLRKFFQLLPIEHSTIQVSYNSTKFSYFILVQCQAFNRA